MYAPRSVRPPRVALLLTRYSADINNYNAAISKYTECMKQKRFKKFVDDVMTSLAIMDLDSLPSYLSTSLGHCSADLVVDSLRL